MPNIIIPWSRCDTLRLISFHHMQVIWTLGHRNYWRLNVSLHFIHKSASFSQSNRYVCEINCWFLPEEMFVLGSFSQWICDRTFLTFTVFTFNILLIYLWSWSCIVVVSAWSPVATNMHSPQLLLATLPMNYTHSKYTTWACRLISLTSPLTFHLPYLQVRKDVSQFATDVANNKLIWNMIRVPPMLVHTCTNTWIKRIRCHVGCQEVNRCCTRGESEESIALWQWSMEVRDPPWLGNPGQTSPNVQNRVNSGP